MGGAPANFAVHANALGADAAIVSSVGNDPEGIEILHQLSNRKVAARYIQKTEHSTGSVDVRLNDQGLPSYAIRENVAWDFIQMSEEAQTLVRTCHAICFGTLAQRNPVSRTAIHRFLSLAPPRCLRIFDINLRQQYFSKDIIERSLQAANALKLNEEELIVLRNLLSLPCSTKDALEMLMARYALEYIALTRGANGSLMMNLTEIVECPGVPLTIQDTIGAGDSFAAAMTFGILHGLPLDAINRIAGKVAAFVCTHAGATPDLPARLIAEFNTHVSIPVRDITNPGYGRHQKQGV
jgi:fructokinase